MRKLGLLALFILITASVGFSTTIESDSIDGNTSLSGWTRSSTSYAEYYTGTYKVGTAALRVRYTGTATKSVDTTGYTGIVLSFKLTAYSLESGEYVYVEYNDGSGWTQAGSRGDGQDNGTFQTFSVNLPSSCDNNSSFQVRVRISSSSTSDYGYMDDLTITGTASSGGGTVAATTTSTSTWQSDSASYTSPSYPSAYPNNQDVTTTITKSGATKIRVKFSAFDTESNYDYVYILDGSGNQVASYTGSKGAFTSIEVTGDTLKVRFVSDYSVTKTGFKIDTVEYLPASTGGGSTGGGSTGGGTTETWQSETVSYTSPSHPGQYPNNQNVTETITKSGSSKIRVHFSAFDTESGYDYVYILDGSGNQVASYNGSKGAFTSAEVTGDTLKVKFTSDGSVTRTGYKIDKVEYLASGGDTGGGDTGGGDTGTSTTIFEDTFASSTLGSSWSTSGTGDWRVQVSSSYTPHSGSYHVLLDDSTSGGDSTAQLILNKDLSSYSSISVEFYYKEYGDENHTQDGFYVYADGSWVQAQSFNNGPSSYTKYTVDLSSYNNITKLKWQQYDNYPMTSDGVCIDDVKITGISSGGGSTGGGTATASSRSGMGAIVYSGGVAFRVWAPFATSVAVAGEFNSWSGTANPLASEGNGYWSVDVSGASAGQYYKFVVNGDSWKKDPYSRKQEHSSGASIVYETGSVPSGIGLPYFEDMVIYQIHVGSYTGSSSTGISDFYDVAAKASYIDELGVNMVELLPVMEFPGDNSWGYNPADVFAPESAYGGPEGLKALVTALHNKGIGLICDIVYNHLGPSDMDLWQFDGWSENSGGGIYFYNDWKAETPWGHTRPDYGRGEVRTFLKDNAVYWLNEFNVDGLRWDSTINIRKVNYSADLSDGWSLMQWINNEIDSAKGAAISIAEDLQEDAWITYPTSSGGAGFDSQWDAGFVHPIKTAIEASWDSDRNMYDVSEALHVRYGERSRQVIYVSSHDEVGNGKSRPPTAIDSSNPGSWFAKKRTTLGTGILMTAPGIPMIFQGEEFLQDGWFDMDVANNYLDWGNVTTYNGILQMYKDLITLRNTYGALRSGNINVFHIDNDNKLIAYHRWDGYQNMVVIANFADKSWNGDYQIGWPVWKTGHCVFNGDWNGYSSDFGNHGGWDISPTSGSMDGMSQKISISIAPYTVQVYDLY